MPPGLRHSSDDTPGIRRRPRGKGFSYTNDSGQTVSSLAERQRLARLAIPPAYRDVWICLSPQGHFKQPGATRGAANNIFTTPTGALLATKPNLTVW